MFGLELPSLNTHRKPLLLGGTAFSAVLAAVITVSVTGGAAATTTKPVASIDTIAPSTTTTTVVTESTVPATVAPTTAAPAKAADPRDAYIGKIVKSNGDGLPAGVDFYSSPTINHPKGTRTTLLVEDKYGFAALVVEVVTENPDGRLDNGSSKVVGHVALDKLVGEQWMCSQYCTVDGKEDPSIVILYNGESVAQKAFRIDLQAMTKTQISTDGLGFGGCDDHGDGGDLPFEGMSRSDMHLAAGTTNDQYELDILRSYGITVTGGYGNDGVELRFLLDEVEGSRHIAYRRDGQVTDIIKYNAAMAISAGAPSSNPWAIKDNPDAYVIVVGFPDLAVGNNTITEPVNAWQLNTTDGKIVPVSVSDLVKK